jgi:hypothetical protein
MRFNLCVSAVLIATATGCSSAITWPNWCHPGYADVQRKRAERYDPYPEVDFGQWMYGTRPRDFQVPPSEPQQVQTQDSFFQRFGRLAPTSKY